MDTFLSNHFSDRHLLKCFRAQISEVRMPPVAIVEHLDVINDFQSRFFPSSEVR